eukprot:scaffold297445_cov22-Prasinocladus_malaysianus.AAC.2
MFRSAITESVTDLCQLCLETMYRLVGWFHFQGFESFGLVDVICTQAERAEREVIRAEEDATRERHRKAFDDMVAAARERARTNPPPPHDPMRFRAVPPGESDSDDDSDLPPSCRVSRTSRGIK